MYFCNSISKEWTLHCVGIEFFVMKTNILFITLFHPRISKEM